MSSLLEAGIYTY